MKPGTIVQHVSDWAHWGHLRVTGHPKKMGFFSYVPVVRLDNGCTADVRSDMIKEVGK